jgi:hypothetical protein
MTFCAKSGHSKTVAGTLAQSVGGAAGAITVSNIHIS